LTWLRYRRSKFQKTREFLKVIQQFSHLLDSEP